MKRRYILLTLVLLLPALAGITALAATSDAVDNINKVPAAIVNLDTPTTLDSGQTLPAGRQLVGNLQSSPSTTQDGHTLDWKVLSAATARSGLEDGTYYAVVTIPDDFSTSVAAVLQGKSTEVPKVTVETAPSSPIMGSVTQAIVQSAARELGTTLTVSYLDTSLSSTGKLSEALGSAAAGANQLADGQKKAADGAHTLADGTGTLLGGLTQLADGTTALADGAGTLAHGVGSYTAGVNSAAGGAQTLAGGAATLADGVHSYTDGVQQVYNGITQPQQGATTSLQDGAHAVAAGAQALNQQLQNLDVSGVAAIPGQLQAAADGAHAIAGAMTEGQSAAGVPALTDLIAACQASQGDPQTCGMAQAVAQGIAGKAQALGGQLQDGAHSAQGAAGQLAALNQGKAQVAQLAAGAASVSGGLDQVTNGIAANLLGKNAAALNTGATGLETGAQTLAGGLGSLQKASGDVNSGAKGLADGANTLEAGAAGAATGAQSLADGASQLADGTGTLTDGTDQLASGLGEAVSAIPTYAEDAVPDMASAIAAPIGVTDTDVATASTRNSFAAGAAAIALWIGTLMAVLAIGSLNRRRIDDAATPLRLTLSTLWPAVVISALQAVLLMVALAIGGVHMTNPFGVMGVLVALGVALAIVQEAFVAAFGRRGGTWLSLFLLVAQAASLGVALPAATRSGFAAFIANITPGPQAASALQTFIVGGSAPVGPALTMIGVWAVVAFAVAVAAVKKRRQTSLAAVRAAVKA